MSSGPATKTAVAVVLSVLVLAAAGCGGGGRSSSPDQDATAQQAPRPAPITKKKVKAPAQPPLWRREGNARPNVMVVMLDDMRSDEMKYLPNVRKYVVDRGLSFDNSFSPYPLCCPARSSFLLGEYAHNHHVLYHEAPYGFGAIDDSRTLATSMQAAGYNTAMVGKYLNKYGVQNSKVTGRSSIHYVPAGWTDWMAGLDTIWDPASGLHGNTYNYFDFTQNINGQVVMHPGEYSSTVVADQVGGLVEKYHRDTKPWFLWVTPVAPHFGGPREYDDPADVTEADGRVQSFETPARPDSVRDRFDGEITHAPGVRADGGPSEADVRDKPFNIRKYHEATPEENVGIREIARQRAEALYAWDVEFGRIVDRLKATGEYDRTLIMFTSDNGYYLGEHRQRQGKIKPHEPVIHVPLAIAGPGVRYGVRQTPITTFDLTSTILDIAGGTLPKQDGESKADAIYGPDRDWSYPMVTEGLLPDVKRKVAGFDSGLTTIGIRTGRWKLVRYANGDEELYDLVTDPLELTSHIGDPRYRRVQRDLTRMWWAYKDCQGAQCRYPLPARYRTTPAELQHQHDVALRETRAYYGG